VWSPILCQRGRSQIPAPVVTAWRRVPTSGRKAAPFSLRLQFVFSVVACGPCLYVLRIRSASSADTTSTSQQSSEVQYSTLQYSIVEHSSQVFLSAFACSGLGVHHLPVLPLPLSSHLLLPPPRGSLPGHAKNLCDCAPRAAPSSTAGPWRRVEDLLEATAVREGTTTVRRGAPQGTEGATTGREGAAPEPEASTTGREGTATGLEGSTTGRGGTARGRGCHG